MVTRHGGGENSYLEKSQRKNKSLLSSFVQLALDFLFDIYQNSENSNEHNHMVPCTPATQRNRYIPVQTYSKAPFSTITFPQLN